MERISHAPAMRCHALLVIVAASSSFAHACAQSWSVAATAPAVGKAHAMVNTSFAPLVEVYATLPVGPVAPGTFFVNAASVSAAAGHCNVTGRAEWTPSVPGQTAPLAFRVHTEGGVSGNHVGGPNFVVGISRMIAVVHLTLQAPQATSGRLVVRHTGGACDFGRGWMDFDVDADGTVELAIESPYSCNSPWSLADLPLVIPAAGKVIALRVRHHVGANVSGSGHGGSLTVEAQFFPGQAAVQVHVDPMSAAYLLFAHRLDDTVHLQPIGNGYYTTAGSMLVFGAQPTAVTLTPTLTQLVTLDAVAPAPFTAPMPQLPPGTSLYCQGVVLATSGALHGTESLRAYWP